MKKRYRLIRRGNRGKKFYCVDSKTGKRSSLGTDSEDEAEQLVEAKNNAERQPTLNLQIARAYLAGTDNGITTRTWQDAFTAVIDTKHGATQTRWRSASKDQAFDAIRHQVIVETQGSALLKVLQAGTVCTNIFLRRLHNFCLDMDWLLKPIIPQRQWPKIKFREKRAITWEEHQKIIAGESNAELRDFYELLWELGGSQTDVASLRAEDVDWTSQTISYARQKTGSQTLIRFGNAVIEILKRRPASGYLFPQVVCWKESDRGKAFIRRLRLVGISGISLHSYRYAWAERALQCGYPERFAQEALGHRSKAVHYSYAKRAQVLVPSLEEWKRNGPPQNNIVAVQFQKTTSETVSAQNNK